jgi:hypothetical protein
MTVFACALDHPLILTVFLTLCYVAVRVGLAWVAPFARCRPCQGSGWRDQSEVRHRLKVIGRRAGLCGRCAGSGRRVRLLRRLHTHLVREAAAGTTATDRDIPSEAPTDLHGSDASPEHRAAMRVGRRFSRSH